MESLYVATNKNIRVKLAQIISVYWADPYGPLGMDNIGLVVRRFHMQVV